MLQHKTDAKTTFHNLLHKNIYMTWNRRYFSSSLVRD